MWFDNIAPSDVVFKEELRLSQYSQLLLVELRGHICVMKVHRSEGPDIYAYNPQRETDIHTSERNAYQRLAQHGVCDSGIVPKFYGVIDKIDVKPWQPLLSEFLNDEYPPSAIIIEYIPGMRVFWLDTYSKVRKEGFERGIKEIHKAGVWHGDIYPRNMMVFDNEPERVMLIDFDRAQVDDGKFFTPERLRDIMESEERIVTDIGERIEHDVCLGYVDKCALFT